MKTVLVVANETIGGRALIEAVKASAPQEQTRASSRACPQNAPAARAT